MTATDPAADDAAFGVEGLTERFERLLELFPDLNDGEQAILSSKFQEEFVANPTLASSCKQLLRPLEKEEDWHTWRYVMLYNYRGGLKPIVDLVGQVTNATQSPADFILPCIDTVVEISHITGLDPSGACRLFRNHIHNLQPQFRNLGTAKKTFLKWPYWQEIIELDQSVDPFANFDGTYGLEIEPFKDETSLENKTRPVKDLNTLTNVIAKGREFFIANRDVMLRDRQFTLHISMGASPAEKKHILNHMQTGEMGKLLDILRIANASQRHLELMLRRTKLPEGLWLSVMRRGKKKQNFPRIEVRFIFLHADTNTDMVTGTLGIIEGIKNGRLSPNFVYRQLSEVIKTHGLTRAIIGQIGESRTDEGDFPSRESFLRFKTEMIAAQNGLLKDVQFRPKRLQGCEP